MLCDVAGCIKEAVSFGQGFELGKEVSSRCPDHPWTLDEIQRMRASSERTNRLWALLDMSEQDAILATLPEDRSDLFRALLRTKMSDLN